MAKKSSLPCSRFELLGRTMRGSGDTQASESKPVLSGKVMSAGMSCPSVTATFQASNTSGDCQSTGG